MLDADDLLSLPAVLIESENQICMQPRQLCGLGKREDEATQYCDEHGSLRT